MTFADHYLDYLFLFVSIGQVIAELIVKSLGLFKYLVWLLLHELLVTGFFSIIFNCSQQIFIGVADR